MKAVLYLRFSTNKQAERVWGWIAQEGLCREACKQRGWEVVAVVRDPARTAEHLDRPGLREALEQIARGEADVLVVKDLERLTRDVSDLMQLLDWFEDAPRATVVAVEFPMDLATPAGRDMARNYMTFAQSERGRTSARTSQALKAKRARGEITGRPAVADRPEVEQRMRELRREGLTYVRICSALEQEGFPTARGAKQWRTSALQRTLGPERRKPRHRRVELPSLHARKRLWRGRSSDPALGVRGGF